MPETQGGAAMNRFIVQMPKAELHVHLEGTLEPELSFALAEKNQVSLPYKTPEAMLAAYDFYDLPSFLEIYYAGMSVLQKEEDFYQLTWDYLERARRESIRYVEMFFDPQAHTTRGVSFKTVITGIHRAQVDAKTKFGIESQLIMCFLRDMSAESAMRHLDMLQPYREWVIGVGLDSDEKDNPPIKFKNVFSRARQMGLHLTMHCDVNQKNTLIHIDQCLNEIEVERIDHGLNTLENETICRQVIERKIGLTVCPVSNHYVVDTYSSEEVRRMLQKGMLATINSDDPAYFRAYLNDNLIAVQEDGQLTRDEIGMLVANAFRVAWLPEAKRDAYLYELECYMRDN
jgi:adenosine deaminase